MACVALALSLPALADAPAPTSTVTLDSGDYRSVELGKDVDIAAWAQRNDVSYVERLPVASGGSIVRFKMDEGVWRARRDAMCTDTGVVSCGTDFCQQYFVPTEEQAAPATTAAAPAPADTGTAELPAPELAGGSGEDHDGAGA